MSGGPQNAAKDLIFANKWLENVKTDIGLFADFWKSSSDQSHGKQKTESLMPVKGTQLGWGIPSRAGRGAVQEYI